VRRARRNAARRRLEMFDWWKQAEKAESFEFASKAAVLPLMRHHMWVS
jgi:hypothetical protein